MPLTSINPVQQQQVQVQPLSAFLPTDSQAFSAFVPSQQTNQLLAAHSGTPFDILSQYGLGLSQQRAEEAKAQQDAALQAQQSAIANEDRQRAFNQQQFTNTIATHADTRTTDKVKIKLLKEQNAIKTKATVFDKVAKKLGIPVDGYTPEMKAELGTKSLISLSKELKVKGIKPNDTTLLFNENTKRWETHRKTNNDLIKVWDEGLTPSSVAVARAGVDHKADIRPPSHIPITKETRSIIVTSSLNKALNIPIGSAPPANLAPQLTSLAASVTAKANQLYLDTRAKNPEATYEDAVNTVVSQLPPMSINQPSSSLFHPFKGFEDPTLEQASPKKVAPVTTQSIINGNK